MIKELVTKENPVAIYHHVMMEFAQEGMAINCGQILMCDGGNATLYINYKRTDMRAGTIVMMKPGDIVHGVDMSDDYQLSCLAYEESIQREASFRVESMVNDYLTRGFYTTETFLGRFFHQILGVVDTLMNEEAPRVIRDVTVMQLRSFFLVCYERLVRGNADIKCKRKDMLYSRFFDLLIHNHREERSVNFYADRMNVTTRYLNEIVNHATGQSAKTLIDDYVITQLSMALRVSTKTVTQIAWDYNFESLPFFCDYFKHRTGMTPQTFRDKGQS
jgi:AraC-like DNA-binding protein